MLIIGILFILFGMYVIISDKYKLVNNNGVKEFVIKEEFKKDRLYRYKIALGLFSTVLGVFSILNYIIY
ncbi:hypothetical protein [Anaerosalibacter sp. Marseille-P3206]|uniref:hypothetical protein n=1 Tax=Anaerosalibacter sp. Marseille-P3206 TaxID=1871005 RepID=UPI000987315F|nr:hypothetical protein [Anaerosalibacter sp. Marseille-P3206]